MGGGVMRQTHLFPRIQRAVQALLNDYIALPALREQINHYIVPAVLGEHAGICGAFALAAMLAAHDEL